MSDTAATAPPPPTPSPEPGAAAPSPAGARGLFDPLVLGPLTLRNRFVRSAAFEGMCPGGEVSGDLVAHHREVAAGGVGMTTVAYAAVLDHGRTFEHQLWMRPEVVPGLRRLADAVHAEGAAVSIQLGHGGHMADRALIGRRPWAPSRVFALFGLTMPRAMSLDDIAELRRAFAASVRWAREAGMDAVEVQAGHGYLLGQFLAPHTNRRQDAYGGTPENRARLVSEVVRAALDAAGGEVAVVVKMSLRDGFAGGCDLPDAIALARRLEEDGAHGLVLSGGFVSKTPMYLMRGEVPYREMAADQPGAGRKLGLLLFGRLAVRSYPFTEAYFLEDAVKLRAEVELPLILVGGLRTRATMQMALDRGMDGLAMARPTFREPDFVARLERGETDASLCEPCNLCMATMYHGQARCPEREKNGE